MSLSEDLLQQARDLCALDPRRPRHANLRRAVSAAYYATFRALIASAVDCMMPVRSELRPLLARKFQHGVMKATAERTAQIERQKVNGLRKAPGGPAPDLPLLFVASAFVNLQEARHLADYAPDEVFTRLQTAKLIDDADKAIQALQRLSDSPAGERLLWELLLGKLER